MAWVYVKSLFMNYEYVHALVLVLMALGLGERNNRLVFILKYLVSINSHS